MANFQKIWAIIVGIIFILIGIIGFFTPSVFKIFSVNLGQNLIHLVTGLIFLVGGIAKATTAKKVNIWFGIIYVLIAILGFVKLLGFLNIETALQGSNFLHLILGLITLIIGFAVKTEPGMMVPSTGQPAQAMPM